MAKVTAQIQFASNVQELKAQIAGGTGSIIAMKDAVDRTARSLGGEGLMRAAHNTTAAVQQLGGATKLTAAEKDKINTQLTKAIEKYTLLGREAPSAMVQLEQATRRVHEPSNQLNTQMVALGSAIGSFIGNVAYNAVQRLGTAVATMVSEGARMSITVDSFERLATGIGQSGDAMLSVTRTATKGLITDLDIMQASNKAMLLGLPVTSTEMGTLSKAAVTLGRAMGQDAKTSLNDLITALGRSSPLILDNLGLTVKVGQANEEYARSLGKTASELTDAEKKTAFYNAAMNAAKVKTEELGGVQLKFTDQATRLSTTFTNLVRDASSFVSEGLNPLSSGMSGIPDSMMTATVAIGSLSAAVVAGKLAIAGITASLGTGMGAAAAATAMATLTSTLALLWPVVAVGATAFGAWKLGSFIGEISGLTDGVERLAGRLMGLSDAEIQASQAARRHTEQRRELQPLIEQATAGLPKLDAGLKAIALSELEVKHIEEQLTASAKEAIETNKKYAEELTKLATQGRQWVNTLEEMRFAEIAAQQAFEKSAKSLDVMALALPPNVVMLQAFRLASMGLTNDGLIPQNQAMQDSITKMAMFANQTIAVNEQVSKSPSVFAGMKSSLKGLWEGLSGGNGITGVFSNLGKGIMDGLGNIVSGGISSLISSGVGLAVQGLTKLFGGIFGKSEGRKQLDEANSQIAKLQQDLLATHGSLENIIRAGGAAGQALADAWGSQNVAGLAHFKDLLGEFNAEMERQERITAIVDNALGTQHLQRYNDLIAAFETLTPEQKANERVIWQLTQEYRRLQNELGDVFNPELEELANNFEEGNRAGRNFRDEMERNRGSFASLTGAVDILQAKIANTEAINRFQGEIGKAQRGVSFDFQTMLREFETLKGSLGNTPEIAALETALLTAAQTGRFEFGEFSRIFALLRDQMLVPITVKVAWDIANFPDLPSPGAGGNSRNGRATQADIDDFLRRNPGDVHRVPGAFGNVTDTNGTNSHGFATGTHGQFIDFGAGTDVTLHGREAVVTEAEGRADARGLSRLIDEVRELRAGQARQARNLEEALMRAFTYGPAYARAR